MNNLLTTQELADKIGVSLQTLYNRRASGGSLPKAIVIGRLVRYDPQDVLIWLNGLREQDHQSAQSAEVRRRGRPTKEEQMSRRKSVH